MELTHAEDKFFNLIENGARVNNKTTGRAKCGRAFSTVVRNMGYVDENGYYNGVVPIPNSVRMSVKKEFIAYNNKHKGRNGKVKPVSAPDKSTDEYLIARLKYIIDQLRARGYEVDEVKITYTI